MFTKSKFSQINDKRFYFPGGIFFLPFHHPILKELNEFKKEKGQRIEKNFWQEKERLLEIERKALRNNNRLYLHHQILMTEPKIFFIDKKENFKKNSKIIRKNTKDVILEGKWMLKA